MSNELNGIIARCADGVREGVAIGGDRYPGTTFIDHLVRFQADPGVKMMVLLGEVGGTEEYDVCRALQQGVITKPLVAWCIGTCAASFASEVQFGHAAGSCASAERETAQAKNKALAKAGAVVPQSFDDLDAAIHQVFGELLRCKIIEQTEELPSPPAQLPMDYSWARQLGLVRKPAGFVSSVSDERGEELLYAGMPVSQVVKNDLGVGGIVSLLWFQRLLPDRICKFFELCIILTADHGPAVSGALATIVCTQAGKDVIASLTCGLQTIVS